MEDEDVVRHQMALTWTSAGWGVLAIGLAIGTFGLSGIWAMVTIVLSFLFGLLVSLYLHARQRSRELLNSYDAIQIAPPKTGLPQLVAEVKRPKPGYKADKRMTGASQIDEVLQEVLEYTYRDYILSWYKKISDNEQFQHDIRITLQQVVIAFSERAKVVDLVPFLTTQLVDDFASHIRLYRRAQDKYKEHACDSTKPLPDLESFFFDLETDMERSICRDNICISDEDERQYLQDLSEVLLFLLLPPEDFHNKPFRYIVREVLVNGVFLPTINLFSDPDYINQTLVWLCQNSSFTSETFLTVIKMSDNIEELKAVKEKVDLDIARQRSRDTGGTDDTEIKQQLSSLIFLRATCESRIKLLQEGRADSALSDDINAFLESGMKLYSLRFDVVLNNNVALSHFMEYMTNIGAQAYLFLYLNIEAYKVSAEQQMSAQLLDENATCRPDVEHLGEAVRSIYDQYLSNKATIPLKLDETSVKKLEEQIRKNGFSDTIFDDVQERLWRIMQDDYYPEFKNSQLYIKMLAELDLLRDTSQPDDLNMLDTASLSSSEGGFDMEHDPDRRISEDRESLPEIPRHSLPLSAEICNTGICREHGKAYAVYLITVTRYYADGTEDKWDVYRRYSDFHDLHLTIQERYDSLPGLVLPGKKTFNNMNPEFLEKRKVALNGYLQVLLSANVLNSHPGLLELAYQFLESMVWTKERSQFSRKMDTLVNPIRSMGSFVKSMPDNLADGVTKVSAGFRSIPSNMLDGMGKVLGGATREELQNSAKVGAVLEAEHDEENIPLRIMLLLMDEVFDLKSRNQWLRRRIVTILRQIVKATLGDSINKKIVDYVEWLTCADQIAEYVKAFRDSFWPNGVLAEPRPTRDIETQMRTRIACKAKMIGSISDEVRHLIGSETTKHGVIQVFTMFQHQHLNKRLLYVCLEGLLQTLFPDNKFQEVFHKIHSRSTRVKGSKGEGKGKSKSKKGKS